MSFGAAVSSLAYATFHPLQTSKAVYAALVAPVQTGTMRQCIDLLSCVSINGLQLLTVCPKLITLLGTQQMEEVAIQSVALLQAGHHLLQSSEVKVIAAQTLSLISSRACGALLQQLSCMFIAVLRLCQTDECTAANEQIATALQSILLQITPSTPATTTPAADTSTFAVPVESERSAAVWTSSEWSESMDMLLYCHQLHHSQQQQLSTSHWLRVRSLLSTRDTRLQALWQRWKGRLIRCDQHWQQSVRDECEQYRLAGEDEGEDGVGEEEEAADANSSRFVIELQALVTSIVEDDDGGVD